MSFGWDALPLARISAYDPFVGALPTTGDALTGEEGGFGKAVVFKGGLDDGFAAPVTVPVTVPAVPRYG